MKWYVVPLGLLLTDAADAIECREPQAPELPVDTPLDQRAERRLSRDVVRYMSDTGKFIACLREEENFGDAREHLRNMIASGGLTQDQLFRARIALADVDVMQRLSKMADPPVRDSNLADNSKQ